MLQGYALAPKNLVEKEHKVCYMYRDIPDCEEDTGWRLFAGYEKENDRNNPDKVDIYDINTIISIDPDIIPFLFAQSGSAFSRKSSFEPFEESAFPEVNRINLQDGIAILNGIRFTPFSQRKRFLRDDARYTVQSRDTISMFTLNRKIISGDIPARATVVMDETSGDEYYRIIIFPCLPDNADMADACSRWLCGMTGINMTYFADSHTVLDYKWGQITIHLAQDGEPDGMKIVFRR